MPTIIDSLIVSLGLDAKNFNEGQKSAVDSLKKIEATASSSNKAVVKSTNDVHESFQRVTRSALGFLAVIAGGRGLQELFTNSVQTSAAMGRMAQNIGMSTSALSGWENAARSVGGTADATGATLTNLGNSLYNMKYMGQLDSSLAAILNLGLPLQDKNGNALSPDQILDELGDKFQTMPREQAFNLSRQMGMDTGTFNLIDRPKAERDALIAANTNTNAAEAAAAQKLQTQFATLESQVVGVSNDIMLKMMPAIDQFAVSIMLFVKGFEQSDIYKAFAYLSQPATTLNTINSGVQSSGSAIHSFFKLPSSSSNPFPNLTGSQAGLTDQQKSVRDQAMAYFQSQGWTVDQAAGIVANMGAESSYNANNINPTSGAYGLFQDLGSRKAALFAKYGPNPTAQQQMEFAQWELTHTESAAGDALRSQTSSFGAGVSFNNKFERNGGGWASQYSRGAMAQNIAAGAKTGLPASVNSILAGLRKSSAPTHVSINNVNVHAPNADPKKVVAQMGKTLHSSIVARTANTGLS